MTTTTPLPVTPTAVDRGWLTPARCRVGFVALMAVNLVLGWRFLTHDCPIDLSGDEAQYWTWSRHLAAGYYSKGPLVAWIIRASCRLLGDTMPGVRAPALVLAVGTSCCTYWLTLRLFRSDRLALGAVVLGAIVPMYAVGGTLMTIDPPMFFGWAVATCFLAAAAFDGRRWAWPAAGLAIGVAALAKYGALLWLPLAFGWLLLDPAARRHLRSPWPWLMVAVAVGCLAPPVWWNAHHGWVTVQHVSAQTTGGEPGSHGNLLEFVGAQVAAVNPALCVFLVAGAIHAVRSADPHRRQLRFLLALGGGFWLVVLVDALLTKVQPNWPAPAYFTLLILTAHFIATRWNGVWKPWRGWFWGAVAFGLIASTLVRNATVLYPVAAWVDRTLPARKPGKDGQPRAWVTAKAIDPATKMHGVKTPFATAVDAELRQLPPGAFVLCEDYMDAAQLEFYLPGQPATYFAGSYWTDPNVRRRWTQFDVWPDRRLDQPQLFDLDAVYVGFAGYAPLRESFARVTRLPDIVVTIDGLEVRRWEAYRCEKFKGMRRPPGPGPR